MNVSVPRMPPSSSRASRSVWFATTSSSCSSVGGVRASDSCGRSARIVSTSSGEASVIRSMFTRDLEADVPGWRRRRTRGQSPHILRSAPASGASSQQSREAPILEYAALGLALRAVVDRVLVEVDARKRRAAAPARLAEPVVDAIGLRVVRAREPQLEPALELVVHRGCQPLDLLVGELCRRSEEHTSELQSL